MHTRYLYVPLLLGFALCLGLIAYRSAPAVAADPLAQATATPTPVPFTAEVEVVAMYPAMGAISPDTGRPTGILVPRGDDPTKRYALFGPGAQNIPPGVPVYVEAGAISLAEGAQLKNYAWELKVPSGSAATIAKVDKAVPGLTLAMATFTPDLEGEYVVSLIVADDKGATSQPGELKITAAKYVGSEVCAGCHKEQYDGWSQTAHGSVFKRFVNENAEGEYFSAGFGCARCHTVGYYPVKESTGGWWDTFVNVLKLDWNKDLKDKIALNAFNEEPGKDTFSGLDPKLQAVSNIGCESCHGPAGAHVAKPGLDTAPIVGAESGVCSQCHDASGHHTRGGAIRASAHSDNADLGEGNRTPCNTCHSGEGHIDVANGVAPDKIRAVNSNLGCQVCHDPHSATNSFQLRQVEKAKLPTAEVTNAGLSASCMSCHNNRTDPKSVETDKPSYPHYSSAAEQIAGIGGYDFGVKLENAYHVNIGKGVINDEHTNQPGNMAFTQVNDGKAPGACVLCHMYQTPGGTWDTKDSLAVPGHQQIGGHTFNMVAEVDGKEVEHTAPCQQCHPGVTTFNFTADADADGNGKIEGVQTEVKGLLDMLQAAILAKAKAENIDLKTQQDYPYFVIPADAKLSLELKGAIYNFRYVNGVMWDGAGKAAAIHNFERSVGLLQVSYTKVTGKDVPGATLLYTK
jgi:predicted CXXCH cytochrome family protein